MEKQLLFDLSDTPVRRSRKGCGRKGGQHPLSDAARRRLEDRGLTNRQKEVLRLIVGAVKITDNELVAEWVRRGGNPNTPRARRVELHEMRCVEPCGESNGSTLWRCTALGARWLQL